MDNLIIRKYVNDDFNEVIKLLKDNFNISDNIKSIDDNLNSFGIVALLNKKIVGYIRIDKLHNPFKNSYYYFLSYVCVDSNYQNAGIATKLLEFIFNDENQWISYWIFELEFGERYEDECIKWEDGEVIPLKTAEDLYDLLIRNTKENGGE